MESIAVRPRLDLRYDVIQSVAPQNLGSRDGLAAALELADWAARRIAPCRIVVYGPDGATPLETRDVDGPPTVTRSARH